MERRYSLRFETGERSGETIPIPPTGLTVGRKPGNSLQIVDNSVSGSHADLRVDDQGVLVRDLGSTNGTRVGSERVLETRLTSGDTLLFGNVRLTFRDARSAAPEPDAPELEGEIDLEPAPKVVPARKPEPPRAAGQSVPASTIYIPAIASIPTPAGDALDRVSAEVVERSKRRSLAGPIVLVVALVAVGVGAWLWLGRAKSGVALRPVEPVAGNLLEAGYSFEGDERAWTPLDGAPAAFITSAGARRSGAQGLEAGLAANEWALERSAELHAGVEREFQAKAWFKTQGDVEARLGLEFSEPGAPDAPGPAPITAWSALTRATDFQAVELHAPVPPGYSLARVVLFARAVGPQGGGKVRVDDVSATESASPAKPAATLGNTGLFLHGEPPIVAHLFRVDRVLVSGLEMTRADAAPGRDGSPLSAHVDGPRIVVEAQKADVLVLRDEAALAHAGIATIGADGYRTHGPEFTRDNVESLLLGSGRDLVRVQFDKPLAVRGEASGAAARISVKLGDGPARCSLQLDFSEENKAAEDLAHAARGAKTRNELGAALAGWRQLLDRFPYEQRLVDEAETARAELTAQGLQELRDTRADLERARFFRLPEMFRACRERAVATGARYAGSDVETDAKALVLDIDKDLAGADADRNATERKRLAAMLAVLQVQKADGLANELRARLSKLEGK